MGPTKSKTQTNFPKLISERMRIAHARYAKVYYFRILASKRVFSRSQTQNFENAPVRIRYPQFYECRRSTNQGAGTKTR
jgi:hypothetical protein